MRIGISGVNGGIGQAVFEQFTAQGIDAIGFARCPKSGQHHLDMRMDEKDIASRIQEAAPGGYDAWFNLAGADVLTPEMRRKPYMIRLQELWEVDVAGTIKCCRAVIPQMRDHGIIVNMTWDEALTGTHGDSAMLYGTAKAAIMGYSRNLAKSLGSGARIYLLAPGWVATRWAHSLNAEQQERLIRLSAGKRWIHPHEVAMAAWQLLQTCPPSGSVIPVN